MPACLRWEATLPKSESDAELSLAVRMAFLAGERFQFLDGWNQKIFLEQARAVIAAGKAADYYFAPASNA